MMKLAFLIISLTATSFAQRQRPILTVEEDSQYPVACYDYSSYAYVRHTPYSTGKYALSYMRPRPACRRFNLSEVEDTIQSMKRTIRDPDLFRLFENCFPNTLDTAITWKGFSNETNRTNEEVCVIGPFRDRDDHI